MILRWIHFNNEIIITMHIDTLPTNPVSWIAFHICMKILYPQTLLQKWGYHEIFTISKGNRITVTTKLYIIIVWTVAARYTQVRTAGAGVKTNRKHCKGATCLWILLVFLLKNLKVLNVVPCVPKILKVFRRGIRQISETHFDQMNV